MTRRILATLPLLLTFDTASAVRVLEQVERAVELSLGELTLPSSDGGSTITFSECATCGTSTHRLTEATVYQANRQTLPLGEFLRVVAEIRGRPRGNETAFAGVFLDIATGRVTRIEVRE